MTSDFELRVERTGHVVTLTLDRPPQNFVNIESMQRIADTLAELDADADCRAIVLASGGKTFCAGADLAGAKDGGTGMDTSRFYGQAMRLFDGSKPIVAAIRGAAIGAGVGLALTADFRVVSAEARFSVNFNRLGFHPGFGLSHTLPRLIGGQNAALLFYTGRRIDGNEALAMHLADQLVPSDDVLRCAQELAGEIAASAPLAVQSTRRALRGELAARVRAINQEELAIQSVQFDTLDFREGVAAMSQRRLPNFLGR